MKVNINIDSYLAKKGMKINGVQFTNKTHNTPSITDTNQDMANYSLKLVKKKKKKYQQGAKVDLGEVRTVTLPEVVVTGHKPSAFDKILGWLKNATLGAAIVENPAVATASGWSIDSKTGKVSQHSPTQAERQLGDNLAVISTFSPTNPGTAIIDAGVRKIAPIILKAASKVKQETPYLFPKAKFYSDNSLVNMYATLARRYNLPDKARLPYLIRRVRSNNLNLDKNGNVILTGDRWKHANFTYDMPVIPHNKGSWDASQQTLLINGRYIIPRTKWGSIEPSDMFNASNTPTIPADQLIDITANPTSKRLAHRYGVQAVSNNNLKTQEFKQLQSEHKEYLDNFGKKLKFAKNDRQNINDEYWTAVQQLQAKFGRPKVKDIRLLEKTTGLRSFIHPMDDLKKFRAIDKQYIMNTPIEKIEEVVKNLPRYNNGRDFNYMKWYDYRGVQKPYKNFFYDPATPAESKFQFPVK